MTAVAEPPSAPSAPLSDKEFEALAEEVAERNKPKLRPARVVLQVFLITVAIVWLVPIVTALYNSFRFYESDTLPNGPFAPPETLTTENYTDAWRVGEMGTGATATKTRHRPRIG